MKEQLEHALERIVNDPNNTTIVDNNGNDHNDIITELVEKENTNTQIY